MIDIELINKCEKELQPNFEKLEEISLFNQEKVLNAFQNNRLALRHFTQTTGYGYGDEGRDTLNAVFADVFKAEMAIVSPSIVSGTHALSLALFGILRPNDSFVSITGEPYDTLNDVIRGENNGSLRDFSVYFDVINLKDDKIDKDVVKEYLTLNKPKMVYLQRSRGYDWRNAFTISEIEDIVKFVREVGFDGCIMLDNCYGEFVEKKKNLSKLALTLSQVL